MPRLTQTVIEEILRKIALKELECLFTTLELHFSIERGEGISKRRIEELRFDIEALIKLKEELP